MVMDDLTLKGVTDPSSIWTVICMLKSGSMPFGLLFLESKTRNVFEDLLKISVVLGSKDGFPTCEVNRTHRQFSELIATDAIPPKTARIFHVPQLSVKFLMGWFLVAKGSPITSCLDSLPQRLSKSDHLASSRINAAHRRLQHVHQSYS